jgi:hypothetical protein
VPDLDDLADAAAAEAVVLFADRARQADAHFVLDGQTGPAVARLVARLDGMPLAIELAAARTEALGVGGLLDRLENRFALLAGGDRLAPARQRSLAAAVEWSYRLLDEQERRAFRAVSVFPGPFTLEAAEAVVGKDAGLAVLRLVECSLLVPPRTGPDGRSRYVMLETLRAYGARLRAEAGEQDTAAAALAGYALRVAEEAAAGLQSRAGEVAAARWLDAEDPAMRQVLAWALARDAVLALRLADALAPWWLLRGRLPGQYPLLREVAALAEPGSDGWCAIQHWLGWATYSAADLGARSEGNVPGGRLPVLADDLFHLLPHGLQADPQRLQGPGGDALTLADQAEQDVLGADVVVAEHPGLFLSQDHNPPRPVGKPLEHLVAPHRAADEATEVLLVPSHASPPAGRRCARECRTTKRSPPAAGLTPPGLGQRASVHSYAGSERAAGGERADHRRCAAYRSASGAPRGCDAPLAS